MVLDVTRAMTHKYDKMELILKIPDVFESLKGKDCDFEQIQTNMLQPLKLCYVHNSVTKSLAVIFVCGSCPVGFSGYTREFMSEASLLFSTKLLNFDEIRFFKFLNKCQMIEKFDILQSEAEDFEMNKGSSDVFAIAIVTLGSGWLPETNERHRM